MLLRVVRVSQDGLHNLRGGADDTANLLAYLGCFLRGRFLCLGDNLLRLGDAIDADELGFEDWRAYMLALVLWWGGKRAK